MLSRFSVRRPYTVLVGIVLIIILGIVSFVNLQTDLLPSIDLPYVALITSYSGASPEEVEMVVTRPIEETLSTTNNINNVSSISSENFSLVILEFNNDANMDSAIIEIDSKIDMIKPYWNDSIGSPMIMKLNPDMLPVMVSSVDIEDMSIEEVTKYVKKDIIPRFESIEGVASVQGVGLVEENLEISINQEKIESLNKKIFSSIDSELSKVEDELLNAKRELEEASTTLESEYRVQDAVIAEGEIALRLGLEKILAAESAMQSGEEELFKNRDELDKALTTIEQKEAELLKEKEELESLSPVLTSSQRIYLAILDEGLNEIQKNRSEMKLALNIIDDKIMELQAQKLTVEANKLELNNQVAQLKEGKSTLDIEIKKARGELILARNLLDEQIEEFEQAKEESYKKASLDGLITEEMVSGILVAQNFSMPAGYITENGMDYLVKIGDKFEDVDELKKLLLFDTGIKAAGEVYLEDVAEIEYKDNSEEIYAKVNGNDAVILVFQKQSTYSTAKVSDNIVKRSNEIIEESDGAVYFSHLMNQGMYIDIVIDSVLDNIFYGGILAILVLILFLQDIKPTFIIALSIPISIVFAIALMYFTGITINVISLAGLALGVGMLVDNSIVVIENIYRLKTEGMTIREASIQGTSEVSSALMGSTLTTIVVFLPIVFTKGITREIFSDMGLTIAYSLSASLLIALTFVPSISSRMLKNTQEKGHKRSDKIINKYGSGLMWALKHKAIIVIFVVSLFGISIYLGITSGTSFMPEMESTQMSVILEIPEESEWDDIYIMTDTVMERIIDIDGIETVGVFQGEASDLGGFGFASSNDSSMSLYVILEEEAVGKIKEIENRIIQSAEDLGASVSISSSTDMTALMGSGIEVLVKGSEIDILREISSDIADILEDIDGTMEISDGIGDEAIEMRVVVDKEKAMEHGLTVAQIFVDVSNKLSRGKTSTTLAIDNMDYPVIVIDGGKRNIGEKGLENLTIEIDNYLGEKTIYLKDVSEIIEGHGLSSIRRSSQERYISVSANIDKDYNIGLVSREFEDRLEEYDLPEGYRIEFSGEIDIINESITELSKMMALSIAFIYLIMVAQFQSLLSPFIVMFTIPLAFTGGLLALVFMGFDISILAILGFLILSGVVVNNGIVLIDYVNQLRESGMSKKEALLQGGKTRMRPIFMTALTTVLGLLTLSMGVGMGSEVLQPMAIAVIGGLTYATILTLFFIPVMYDLFHKDDIDKSLE